MKIIAETDDGFLVAATGEEIAQIRGYAYQYLVTDARKKTEIGTTFNISKVYNNAVETLASYGELKTQLKALQNRTEKLLGLMNPETEED